MVAIPTAALIGIMMTVAVDTFDWESLQLFRTFEITEIVILLVTVGVIVYTHNLAIGIILGVLLSGLLYHFFKRTKKLLALATFLFFPIFLQRFFSIFLMNASLPSIYLSMLSGCAWANCFLMYHRL